MSPAILFDLDGTLVDTAPDLLATMNTLLTREGRSPVDPVALRQMVGRGARNLITNAFQATGAAVEPEHLETLYRAFLEDYASHIAAQSQPFPGVIETLTVLKAEGMRLAVLTNKPHKPAVMLLEALGMMDFFAAVTGQGKLPWLKPDPRLFADIVSELGGADGGVVMVGDSITDVETARNGKAPAVLMTYGYTTEPAETLGADAVLDDFREVPAAVRRLLGVL